MIVAGGCLLSLLWLCVYDGCLFIVCVTGLLVCLITMLLFCWGLAPLGLFLLVYVVGVLCIFLCWYLVGHTMLFACWFSFGLLFCWFDVLWFDLWFTVVNKLFVLV